VPAPRGTTLIAFGVAIFQDFGDLLRGFRQHDDQRQLPVGGQTVRLERFHLPLAVDHAFAGHDRPQRLHDGRTPFEDSRIGLGHFHRHRLIPKPA